MMTTIVRMENHVGPLIPNPFESEVMKPLKEAIEKHQSGCIYIGGMRTGKTQLMRILFAKEVEDAKLIPEQITEE